MADDLSTAPLAPYQPHDLAQAITLSEKLAASKLFKDYGTPEQVLAVMATGAELGLSPTASLRGIYLIEGRPALSADTMVAVCLRSPLCERFDLVESTDDRATYEVQRRNGTPQRFSFSAEDAKRAGIHGKGTHAKYPSVMLRHRAASVAARAIFPDILLGLYSLEEAREMTAANGRPAPAVIDSVAEPIDATAATETPDYTSDLAACHTTGEVHTLVADWKNQGRLTDEISAAARVRFRTLRDAETATAPAAE